MKNVFTMILVFISIGSYSQTLEEYFKIAAENNPVLIAGFGRVGETVANMLEAVNLPYIAIDADADCVARARRHGHHVFFGRAGSP